MNEHTFWELIERTLKHSHLKDNDMEYVAFLDKELKKKSDKEIIHFQIQLLKLRRALDVYPIIRASQVLGYGSSRETFNRFCNGFIAMGKEFYYKAKDDLDFVNNLVKNNPTELKHCYFESFSMIAQIAYDEKKKSRGDWYTLLKREEELLYLQEQKTQNHNRELER